MPRTRNEIIGKLWRGEDPFLSSRTGDRAPEAVARQSNYDHVTDAIRTIRPSVIVVIGVRDGTSVMTMASQLRELAIDGTVIAIDTWLGSWQHWVQDQAREFVSPQSPRGMYATFLRNVMSVDLDDYVVPLPLDSLNAAHVLRHFEIFPNVVYADSGHDHVSVLADIKQWWPLIIPGGLLVGSRYHASNDSPEVKRAFDSFFRPRGLLPLETADGQYTVPRPWLDPSASHMLAAMKLIGSAVSAWRETCNVEQGTLFENENIDVEDRVRRYLQFSGPNWIQLRFRIVDHIVRQLNARGLQFGRADICNEAGELKEEAIRTFIQGFSAHYPRPAPADGFEKFELLGPCENPFTRFALPIGLGSNLRRPRSAPLTLYRVDGGDLFLTPLGYQLFRADEGIYWPAASTRSYPSEAMEYPHRAVDASVVLVQDVFEGTNFCHFLFDWIPRLGVFLDSGIADPSRCVFVMGGAPSEFHVHVIRAMCEIFSVNEQQFVFPDGPQTWHISQSIFFFSDLRETPIHPAHMANKQSIAIIREVCSRIRTPRGDIKRLYISRGDTPLRRITNEDELSLRLRSFGFIEVQLGSIPIFEQISLIRGADVIVAPHGMGLTHIAFHEGRPLIIELHNPLIGSDSYAFMALALGFGYRPVLGTPLEGFGHHFTIRPEDVTKVLEEEGISRPPTNGHEMAAGLRAVFHAGVQSTSPSEMFGMIPSDPVIADYRHVRDDPAVQPDNNVGWLEISGLTRGSRYYCSCEIWLPSDFKGERVLAASSGQTLLTMAEADLSRRNEWQTIAVNAIAERSAVNFVLRCDAEAGAFFYSKKWFAATGGAPDHDRV